MPTRIKYFELTDKNWVLSKLESMSVSQLAKEVGCPASCIRWVLHRYCTDLEVSKIVVERKHKK